MVAGLLVLGCTRALAAPIELASFACEEGPYAAMLPKHYPTLHVIGKHSWQDLSRRTDGDRTWTTRRIVYIGMAATVELDSLAPNQYVLKGLEVSSRRWAVGPLSVGRDASRTIGSAAVKNLPRDGKVELKGPHGNAQLVLRGGRIDSVHYRC